MCLGIITGANSPLGISVVHELIKTHKLICITRPTSDISYLKSLQTKGVSLELQKCDFGSKEQIQKLTKSLCENQKKCNVLINIAFGWVPGGIQEVPDEKIWGLISSSVAGTLLFTKGLLPLLSQTKHSRIINVCSTVGTGYKFSCNTLYVSMKGALDAFGRSLRNELLGTDTLITNLNLGRFEDGDVENKGLTPVQDIAKMIRCILDMSEKTSIDSVVITPAVLNY